MDDQYDEGDIIGSFLHEDVVALYRKVLKERGGGPVSLQNLTGFLSLLDPVPSGLGKSELRRIFLENRSVFHVDAKEQVTLVTHPDHGQAGSTGKSRSRSCNLPPRFAASSKESNGQGGRSCKNHTRSRNLPPRLAKESDGALSSSSCYGSTTSLQSRESLREVRGSVFAVNPSFGFIKADKKHHLDSHVFFNKQSFEGTFQSLTEVLENGQRVVALVRPSDKEGAKAKWVAASVRLADGGASSRASVCSSGGCTDPQRNGATPSTDHCDGESAASLELNKIDGGKGVVRKLLDNCGFIDQSDPRRRFVGGVYFHFGCVKNVPPGKSVKDAVRERQVVKFDAVLSDQPGSKAKWRAVHVWLQQDAVTSGTPSSYREYDENEVYMSNEESSSSTDGREKDEVAESVADDEILSGIPWCRREKLTNQQGRIYALSPTEAEIRFHERETVFAVSKVIYRDGKPLEDDLKWELDDGVAVVFNAISDPDCPADLRWKATLVSVGKGPIAVPNASDSESIWSELIWHYRNAPSVKARSTREMHSSPENASPTPSPRPLDDDNCDTGLEVPIWDREPEHHVEVDNCDTGLETPIWDWEPEHHVEVHQKQTPPERHPKMQGAVPKKRNRRRNKTKPSSDNATSDDQNCDRVRNRYREAVPSRCEDEGSSDAAEEVPTSGSEFRTHRQLNGFPENVEKDRNEYSSEFVESRSYDEPEAKANTADASMQTDSTRNIADDGHKWLRSEGVEMLMAARMDQLLSDLLTRLSDVIWKHAPDASSSTMQVSKAMRREVVAVFAENRVVAGCDPACRNRSNLVDECTQTEATRPSCRNREAQTLSTGPIMSLEMFVGTLEN